MLGAGWLTGWVSSRLLLVLVVFPVLFGLVFGFDYDSDEFRVLPPFPFFFSVAQVQHTSRHLELRGHALRAGARKAALRPGPDGTRVTKPLGTRRLCRSRADGFF